MLESIDLSLNLSKEDSAKQLKKVQLRLVRLQQRIRQAGIPVVIMYEGWDASGKGGSIRRMTEKLDPRGFQVYPIGAPTELEKCHHYLWRFWTRLPACGQIAIFDRSWYGRVLVERVEKFATPEEWRRAYREINDFERMLTDDGTVLVKFWMHISKEEQQRRFDEREQDPYKQWKMSEEDWRNRERWDDYREAAEEMFDHTDTSHAPWRIIAAESKHYARVDTARIVADVIARALGDVGE
jgi:polyphosphate kinase 2 (PPK2 family)